MSNDKKSLVPSQFKTQQGNVTRINEKARQDLAKFREQVQKERQPRRIIFACDATGSRGPTWELARSIQLKMVEDALQYGNMEMKIVAYRDRFADPTDYLEPSDWSKDSAYLQEYMARISCHGGGGNDGESVDSPLQFALEQIPPVSAIILVGDEPVVSQSRLDAYRYATELGKKGIPVFAFQEGSCPQAKEDFQTIAENSGGIYDQFTAESKIDFGDRLRVVTVFATGGKKAVDDFIRKHQNQGKQISQGAQKFAQRLIDHKK